jgi:hypothetical protein
MLLVCPSMQLAGAINAAGPLPNCSRQHDTAAPASKGGAHIAASNVSSSQQPPTMLLVRSSKQPAATKHCWSANSFAATRMTLQTLTSKGESHIAPSNASSNQQLPTTLLVCQNLLSPT